MERRKRRSPARPGPHAVGAGQSPPRPASRAARSAARDEAARRTLAPLAPGERPRPLLAAVALATALGVGNAVAYAAGATIGGRHPGPGVLAFSGLTVLLAAGMWTRRYLAVLAFEGLLALVVMFFALLMVEADNVLALVLCIAVIAGAGWLFWKLVRVMGRLAAPPPHSSG